MSQSLRKMCCDMASTLYGLVISAVNWVGSTAANETTGGIMGILQTYLKEGVRTGMLGLQSFGYAICTMFFLIQLLELAMSEQFTLEYFIKYFSKLVVGYIAVFYAPEIYDKLVDLGNALADIVKDITLLSEYDGPTVDIQEALYNTFDQTTQTAGAGAAVLLLVFSILMIVPMLLAALCEFVIVYIILATRLFEMAIRGLFLPVAMALLSDDGWKGSGGRYLKKFLAICAQGSVLVLIGKLSTMAQTYATIAQAQGLGQASPATTTGEALLIILDSVKILCVAVAIAAAAISIMFKSINVVNDVFGA